MKNSTILKEDTQECVELLVKTLNLAPHPEGGFYRETFRSSTMVTVIDKNNQPAYRAASTSIYYLLTQNNYSAWHKFRSDETWSYHNGCALTIHMLDSHNQQYSHFTIDKNTPQFTVPAHTWFAASLEDTSSFSLVGCHVAPGFDFVDFELATYDKLAREFPNHLSLVERFIREKELQSTTIN